ncbi:MAG: aminotransferase class V-fold PLP-dependent enzyme, partial [Actinomycetia bacterium]|nr:aminotransferase class V-fold PLP-dependent enzyme [Actinomycetes bacterium]
MKKPHQRSQASTAVWGGEDRYLLDRATQVPVVHSVAFGYADFDEWYDVATGAAEGHIYGRNTNPTVAVFEEKVRLLEAGEAATSASTGMAAISNMLHALLRPGNRVVSVKDTYGGTSLLFTQFLPAFGIECELVDTTDTDATEAAIAQGCDLLYLETPTNPTLKVLDLPRLISAGHSAGATVVVDNTFATPINQLPLSLGADLVVHSATKFLGGHADALGGVVVGNADLVEKVYQYREINGATLDPMAAYLLLRGMKTLDLRVRQQAINAMAVATFLEGHERITRVNYPGLASHPQHAIAVAQMSGFGGMLSFA